ncbi:DNA polymerase III subunit beta [Sphingomonas sp. TREG-RG-20F-R18-01]|uniref:DNA polymerase III subunit beta n=1 Tax=Sphingomonas sp. TREG-RG-20F-R18-01 TaxID=2914982 RepID=UPI001F575171
MNIQVKSADFRRAIVLAGKVIERRHVIPILSMVRCHANGSFQATGTDLDMSLTATVARIPGPGGDFVMQSPKNVVSALSAAGGDTVSAWPEDGKVALASGPLTIAVGTLPTDDFPSDMERTITPAFSATLSRDHMDVLARVADAMSSEETRYYLNGLHLRSIGDTTIRAEATDGHRMYFADIELPDAAGTLPTNCIIPRKAVALLFDLAKSADDGVRLAIGPALASNHIEGTAPEAVGAPRLSVSIRERAAEVTFQSKLIDGTFPDVSRIIPTAGKRQFLFQLPDLRRAIAAISGHSSTVRATRITLAEGGTAKISAAFIDIGLSAEVIVPCQHTSPGFEIGYNGKYLSSVIGSCRGSEILFDVEDPSTPGLVRDPADTAWTAVLMPLRL